MTSLKHKRISDLPTPDLRIKSSCLQADYTKLNEKDLVDACRQGESLAQRALYERHATEMQRVACRYLKQSFDVDEALVNAFVKAFQRLDSFEYRREGSFKQWLKTIIINESLMLLRKRNLFNESSDHALMFLEADQHSDDSLLAQEILKLIQTMPDGYRTVFNLYVIEGYSHKEIGEKLGISENTSKSQLSKGRSFLKKLLEKNGIRYEQ